MLCASLYEGREGEGRQENLAGFSGLVIHLGYYNMQRQDNDTHCYDTSFLWVNQFECSNLDLPISILHCRVVRRRQARRPRWVPAAATMAAAIKPLSRGIRRRPSSSTSSCARTPTVSKCCSAVEYSSSGPSVASVEHCRLPAIVLVKSLGTYWYLVLVCD